MIRVLLVLFWITLTWYGPGYYGNNTADGSLYTEEHWGIAAPVHIPLGTRIKVTVGNKYAICTVTDRLGIDDPLWWDASYAVASHLGIIEQGRVVAQVEILEEVTWEKMSWHR